MPDLLNLRDALADRYRIERELGRGGFATVLLAHDLQHDRPVALKVLHPEIAATLGAERFRREIRLAARLQHPHILGVFDSGETAGRLWFTMPFVAGESLRDRIARERQLPVDFVLRIGHQVAEALDYAHRHGVIHRDIKPENILLTETHALVADFGIARALGNEAATQTGVVLGTPAYMSPEQAAGTAPVDARTDIYALGCVLYEMLAGETPFTGPTPQAILARALTETPRALRSTRLTLPPGLEEVIACAMARVPADRFSSMSELANSLTAIGTVRHTSSSTTVAAVLPPPAPARAKRAALAGIAVPVVASLVAAGLWLNTRHDQGAHAEKRLAVLPFENLGSADDDYFADGITDEVRGKLAALPGLQVTARSSAVQYRKTTSKTPAQIGQELGVEYLLTGTVRWQPTPSGGRRVRVSPELIRVADGSARWQQPFDTEISDVFQVQADIASRVAEALDVALGTGAQEQLSQRPTRNVAAYDAFLRGEQLTQSMAVSDAVPLRKAMAFYEQAASLDPGFVEAWAQLGRAACSASSAALYPEDRTRCKEGAERALALASDSPEARLAMSAYLRSVVRDYDAALAQLNAGLQVHPQNAELLAASAVVERSLGKFEQALTHLQHAARLDPRSVQSAGSLARTYHDLHRFEEARVEYDRALSIAPTNLAIVQGKAANYLSQGDLDGARGAIRDALDHVDAKAVVVRFAYFQEMMWVLPDDLRARVVDLQPADFDNDRGMWALKVGNTYLLMGDVQKARSYGDISVAEFQKRAALYADDAQAQELYGRSLALAGRGADAITAGERSLALRETTLDAVSGPYYRYQVARIYLLSGQPDRAMDLIEPLVDKPGDITPGWLRIDPVFKSLTPNPRFHRLAGLD